MSMLCMPKDAEAKIAIAIKERLIRALRNGITVDLQCDTSLHDYERNIGLTYIEHVCLGLEAGRLPGVN